MRSPLSSIPMEKRTKPSDKPILFVSRAGIVAWVTLAGWLTRDSTPSRKIKAILCSVGFETILDQLTDFSAVKLHAERLSKLL